MDLVWLDGVSIRRNSDSSTVPSLGVRRGSSFTAVGASCFAQTDPPAVFDAKLLNVRGGKPGRNASFADKEARTQAQ